MMINHTTNLTKIIFETMATTLATIMVNDLVQRWYSEVELERWSSLHNGRVETIMRLVQWSNWRKWLYWYSARIDTIYKVE